MSVWKDMEEHGSQKDIRFRFQNGGTLMCRWNVREQMRITMHHDGVVTYLGENVM
jgi:hypothetical protein